MKLKVIQALMDTRTMVLYEKCVTQMRQERKSHARKGNKNAYVHEVTVRPFLYQKYVKFNG